MSLFGENLQFYRKRDNLTQEQLAEKLEVSRQTVSKWEAGTSYAEMEKLFQLCEVFSCDMDTLLRKDASVSEVENNEEHRNYMKKFRTGITAGVVLMIADAACYEFMSGLGIKEAVSNTVFMAVAIIAILILIVHGMQDENYKKRHPVIKDFYTEKEKEEFDRRFPVKIAAGIGLILIGLLIFGMNGENLPLRKGMTEDFYYGFFLLCVAAAVGIFVYNGIAKDAYDVDKYNQENHPDGNKKRANEKVSMWCGCIMIAAAIVFFVMGSVFSLWEICWIVFPIGGMLCGIVTLILQQGK